MTEAEAQGLVTLALQAACARDGSSGGSIRLVICNCEGSTKKLIHESDKQKLWDEHACVLVGS